MERYVRTVPKVSNGLPCLAMDIFFPTSGIQGRLGTGFCAGSKKGVYVSTSSVECGRIYLALNLTWTWRHVWETWEWHWGFNRGRWQGGSGRKTVNSRSSYFCFLLFFLGIMLTQHINGQGCLVFDIFVNVFTETYIMVVYLCKMVLNL